MTHKKEIYLFGLMGLILGIILDQLARHGSMTLFYYSIISLFCYLYALSFNEKNSLRLILSSFIVALFLSAPLIGINFREQLQGPIHWFLFFAIFPVFVYIVHCFHYAYHHGNTLKMSYSSLFEAVWNTLLMLFVAAIFTTIAHVLILLTAYIFSTLGNLYLWDLYFNNAHFRLICGSTLFFMGIGVAEQNLEVIYNLRLLLLKIMSFLFPFLALISILYSVLFWFPSSSTQPNYINPIIVLSSLITLGILFFNAYFADGINNHEFPSWLKIFLRAYRVVLFLLVPLLIYDLLKQTPLDINAINFLIVILILTLTYAITALLPESKEIIWIPIGNISAALFFIIVLFLTNLPYYKMPYTLDLTKSNSTVLNTNAQTRH